MKTSHLLVTVTLAAQAQPLVAQPSTPAERPLSPSRGFIGVYVTNFEISYFVECDPRGGGCADWVRQEPRWLSGSSREREVRLTECIVRWNGSRDRWALYAISFRGRETLDRQPKRFLHDTERRVLLDDLAALELIGTDQTADWLLPKYDRRPTVTC
jgi:hypothetical protein